MCVYVCVNKLWDGLFSVLRKVVLLLHGLYVRNFGETSRFKFIILRIEPLCECYNHASYLECTYHKTIIVGYCIQQHLCVVSIYLIKPLPHSRRGYCTVVHVVCSTKTWTTDVLYYVYQTKPLSYWGQDVQKCREIHQETCCLCSVFLSGPLVQWSQLLLHACNS